MVLNKIIDLILDVFIFILLFLAAPLIAVLLSGIMPVYAKITGIAFILLIIGAVAVKIKQTHRKTKERPII